MIEKINCDPGNILGWHRELRPDKIVEYVKLNLEGSRAPSVDVVLQNGVFRFLYKKHTLADEILPQYGGHNRSISHYISGHSLGINLFERDLGDIPKCLSFFPVRKTPIYSREDVPQRTFDIVKEFPDDVYLRFFEMCSLKDSFREKFLGVRDLKILAQ